MLLGMRWIGMLGGTSWESTVVYYQAMNRGVKPTLGGEHSVRLLLASMDFEELRACQKREDWEGVAAILGDAGERIAKAGAECLVIGANTLHLVADQVQQRSGLPLIHIGDATGEAIAAAGLRRVGLLGTSYTMEKPFLREHLERRFGLHVLVPSPEDRATVSGVIFSELIHGQIREESREAYRDVISRLQQAGAEGIILGCTEIPLLIRQEDVPIPVFDTTVLHAEAAVRWSLTDSA